MSLFHLVLLALVQGITEFLPISSSAHLILLPYLMSWADQGPLIDVMAHVGTLFAVLVYFRKDVWSVAAGGLPLLQGKVTPGGRLALLVGVSLPPVLIVGGGFYVTGLEEALRSPLLIAWTTIIFGALLWVADAFAPVRRKVEDLSLMGAFLIGVAQVLAIVPGVSRSGITMTAARALGLDRTESARFSMLMSIPVIAAFGVVAGISLYGEGSEASLADGFIIMGLSFLAAWAAIAVLMKLLERMSFLPFVIYRFVLGALLLWLVLA